MVAKYRVVVPFWLFVSSFFLFCFSCAHTACWVPTGLLFASRQRPFPAPGPSSDHFIALWLWFSDLAVSPAWLALWRVSLCVFGVRWLCCVDALAWRRPRTSGRVPGRATSSPSAPPASSSRLPRRTACGWLTHAWSPPWTVLFESVCEYRLSCNSPSSHSLLR